METIFTVVTPATPAPNAPANSAYNLTTRETVKAELDLKTNDLNAWIDLKLPRLSSICAAYCRRTFAKQSYQEIIRPDRRTGDTRPVGTLSRLTRTTAPPDYLRLHEYPITGITSVIEDDSVTPLVQNTDFESDPRVGALYRLGSSVRVNWEAMKTVVLYDAGFVLPGNTNATLPADIEEAAILFMKLSYHGRKRDPTLRRQEIPGVIFEMYGLDTASISADSAAVPPEVASILDRHRRPLL